MELNNSEARADVCLPQFATRRTNLNLFVYVCVFSFNLFASKYVVGFKKCKTKCFFVAN